MTTTSYVDPGGRVDPRRTDTARFHARGETPESGLYTVGPGGAVGDLWLPAGHPATANLAHGKGPLGLALYTRVD
jgi:hypothetical protein